MKKYIVFLILLIFSTVTFAQVTWPISNRNVSDPRRLRRLLQSRFDNLEDDIAEVTGMYNIGTGNIRYVDSARSNATTIDGKTKAKAEPTLEAAFAQSTDGLTANNGDIVYVLQNHEENFSAADAADLDVPGVTVVNLGEGDDAPTYTYTATGGELVVGAANITFVGGRLLAGISAVTMGVSVEAAGDNFTMIGTEFPEPATATYEFLDAIDLADTANGFGIYGAVYRHASTTGPTHFIDAGNGTNYDMTIMYCDILGEFSVAAIWSDTIDLRAYIGSNTIMNMTTGQHCIEFTAAATGWCVDNKLYGDTEGAILDSGSMYVDGNKISTAIDVEALPVWIIDQDLNHLMETAVADTSDQVDMTAEVPDDTVIANILDDGGDTSAYDRRYNSLVAIAADATNSGTYLIVTSSVTSSSIPSNTQTAGAITGAASGTLLLIDIYCNTDSTALAAPTNLEFSVDNTYGNTGADDVIATEAAAGLGASLSWRLTTDATSHTLPVQIESGKKVFIHGDDSAGTGAGVLQFTLLFQRVTDAATITGNDGPS